MANELSNPIFHDEEAARKWLEARIWADGPVCPHCGTVGEATLMKGKSHRPGLYQCNACRKPFTVTVGTLYERSKVPLNKWLLANHLLCASKKGMSAAQIGRMLGVTYKTAWFMMHRIREAMRSGALAPFGSNGGAVEVDETYFGVRKGARIPRGGHSHKLGVLALVDRDSGTMRGRRTIKGGRAGVPRRALKGKM